jgi:hypothetical protein
MVLPYNFFPLVDSFKIHYIYGLIEGGEKCWLIYSFDITIRIAPAHPFVITPLLFIIKSTAGHNISK